MLLGVAVYQQVHRHNYFGAACAILLLGGLLWLASTQAKTDLAPEPEVKLEPAKYDVGVHSQPRPWITYALIVACCLATLAGWASSNQWVQHAGAISTVSVMHGQWYRIFTAPFFHVSVMHLWMNMASLFYLGMLLETELGRFRFVVIYFASALAGSLGVVAANQPETVGASGAIYGLMGALLYFAWETRRAGLLQTSNRYITGAGLVVAINLVFTFAVPNISAAGHLGGLIAGFFATMLLGIPPAMRRAWHFCNTAQDGVHYSCDATGAVYYHGTVRQALANGYISPVDLATASDKIAWPKYLNVSDLEPDLTVVRCPVPQEFLTRFDQAGARAASSASFDTSG